jgi:hypothetical protein
MKQRCDYMQKTVSVRRFVLTYLILYAATIENTAGSAVQNPCTVIGKSVKKASRTNG